MRRRTRTIWTTGWWTFARTRRGPLSLIILAALGCAAGPSGSTPADDRRFDALDATELASAVQLTRALPSIAKDARIVSVTLEEPAKGALLPSGNAPRQARVVTLDMSRNTTSETLVDVSGNRVLDTRAYPACTRCSMAMMERGLLRRHDGAWASGARVSLRPGTTAGSGVYATNRRRQCSCRPDHTTRTGYC
ncbi:hypothetical protein [Gemmatimonas sp.]|uniref:hypothetical protein n=1 Tax=Gemmatimonas sp. TaxID=1962908 RepID=UPI00356893F8